MTKQGESTKAKQPEGEDISLEEGLLANQEDDETEDAPKEELDPVPTHPTRSPAMRLSIQLPVVDKSG